MGNNNNDNMCKPQNNNTASTVPSTALLPVDPASLQPNLPHAKLVRGFTGTGRDDFNAQALHRAAKNGNVDKLKQLLTEGAPVDQADGPYGHTPLHWASLNNHPAVVAVLLNHDASVDQVDKCGRTPLHRASE